MNGFEINCPNCDIFGKISKKIDDGYEIVEGEIYSNTLQYEAIIGEYYEGISGVKTSYKTEKGFGHIYSDTLVFKSKNEAEKYIEGINKKYTRGEKR